MKFHCLGAANHLYYLLNGNVLGYWGLISKWLLTAMLLVLSLVSVARADVVVLESPRYLAEYSVASSDGFRKAFESLGKAIEPDLVFVFKECGIVNAYYSSYNKSIIICYEYMRDVSNFLNEQQRKMGVINSPSVQGALYTGILSDMLLHEIGHAVIDLKKIPVIGGEEDAADRIATVFLLDVLSEDPSHAQMMFESILAYKWDRRFDFLDKLGLGKNMYADEHPLNEQRMFNVLCLAYGSNQEIFSGLAQRYNLPQSRAVRCEKEYQAAKSAIHQLLR